MNRFVYVPSALNTSSSPPDEAIRLAAETKLPIVIGLESDDMPSEIAVIAQPEANFLSSRPAVAIGFVLPIDYTNEFVEFTPEVRCMIVAPGENNIDIIGPKIREKHSVRFRYRPSRLGKHQFFIKNGEETVLENGVIVFNCATLAEGEFLVTD